MNTQISRVLTAISFAAALSFPASFIQAQTAAPTGPVLTGKGVTEEALTKALAAPKGADPADDGTRTRSLRIGPASQQRMKPSRAGDEPSPGGAKATGVASLLVTFETNSTKISAGSITALDKLARALKSEQLAASRFDVEGHADPRGKPDDNLKLSQGRAESVVEYLVTKHNIDSGRLRPVGKGDLELANKSNQAAPENRRVTVRNQSN